MKRFAMKIMAVMAVFAMGFGLSFYPLTANAEEAIIETPDNSVQSSTTNETETGEEVIEEETESEISAENGVDMETDVATGETEKTDEEVSHSFEDFIAWAEQEAERYGYGDDFASALETIKTAASQKQVTLSTVGSFLLMLAVVASAIYKKVTDKKFKDEVSNISASLSSQFEKIKELVDGTNSNTKTEEEIKAEEQALKDEMTKTKNALENLINGFMHFSSHVGMSNVNKEEVQRDCVKALQCIDGNSGVTANEDNKK